MMTLLNTLTSYSARRVVQSAIVANKGVAMVEFALTLPVLLMLYLGCVQICDVVAVYRKTTTTTKTIVDLTSQQSGVSDAKLTEIFNASTQVMAPYSPSKLKMVITYVRISNTGVATVEWSSASGTGATADTPGDTYTLPAGVGVNNTSLIVGRVDYSYEANIGGFLNTNIPLREIIYMYPRITNTLTKT